MKATSRHKWHTPSGILSRFFIFATSKVGPPNDIVTAVAFGIVELLGAKRFSVILWKAVRTQMKGAMRANLNKKRGAPVVQTNQRPAKTS